MALRLNIQDERILNLKAISVGYIFNIQSKINKFSLMHCILITYIDPDTFPDCIREENLLRCVENYPRIQ